MAIRVFADSSMRVLSLTVGVAHDPFSGLDVEEELVAVEQGRMGA